MSGEEDPAAEETMVDNWARCFYLGGELPRRVNELVGDTEKTVA